jgi:hypothetical protein
MPDLQQMLEDAIERMPAPVTPPFDAIVARARQRRVRRVLSTSSVLTILIIAGVLLLPRTLSSHKGTAVITPVAPSPSPTASGLPGTDEITALAPPVTVDRSGTSVVELGAPPRDANAISLQLTCLSNGTLAFADGAAEVCHAGQTGNTATGEAVVTVLALQPGQHSTTIRAAAGLSWQLSATYVKRTPVPLGVNADGQTYGSTANGAKPDLVAVVATNGKQGYVYATGIAASLPANPSQALAWQQTPQPPKVVPVYESDGKTQIGEFALSPVSATTLR